MQFAIAVLGEYFYSTTYPYKSLMVDSKINFIGIHEEAMGDLALALHSQGLHITTSATTLPIKVASHLAYDLPRSCQSRFASSHTELAGDAVIVGRQVGANHAQVIEAQQMGIPVYSYPAYIFYHAQHKQRIVIIGDEQTVAKVFAIVIHIMNYWGRCCDYVTHLPIATMYPTVRLSDAPVIFLQGDLDCFSELDPRVIASIYQPHIVVITDLDMKLRTSASWPGYLTSLGDVADAIPKAGKLLYNVDISELSHIGAKPRVDVQNIPFHAHDYNTNHDQKNLITTQGHTPIQDMDTVSLIALASAHSLLKEHAFTDVQFYEALSTYLAS